MTTSAWLGFGESPPVDDTISSVTDAPLLRVRGRDLIVDRPLVMGVVNASPESFSDGGQLLTWQRQLEFAERLVDDGADIIDIGGQSAVTNRPGIAASAEIDRVLPIVEGLHASHPELLISVDTYKLPVARAAVATGAAIINDVSGLADPQLAELCGRTGSALVVMHTRARPQTRLQEPGLYGDIATDVLDFLAERLRVAADHGVPAESTVVDPGPDFTKTPAQTVAVLRSVERIRRLGRPTLLALSRKDFLGAILHKSPRGRDVGTIAAVAHFAVSSGCIFRVHDVAATREALDVVDVLTGRRHLDPEYVLPDELRYERPAPAGT